MKLFSYNGNGLVLLVEAFNRGHACKQIAKLLEHEGQVLNNSDPIKEIVLGENPKGRIHTLQDDREWV